MVTVLGRTFNPEVREPEVYILKLQIEAYVGWRPTGHFCNFTPGSVLVSFSPEIGEANYCYESTKWCKPTAFTSVYNKSSPLIIFAILLVGRGGRGGGGVKNHTN